MPALRGIVTAAAIAAVFSAPAAPSAYAGAWNVTLVCPPHNADDDDAKGYDGIVNNPKYAINGAHRGKPYLYRVKAHFDERSGRGQGLTGRACELQFTR